MLAAELEKASQNDFICVNAIRQLAVDMVEAAKSGHPGLPLGAAPMAYQLWVWQMRHNPSDPHWINRDRFILSAGHGSALLYALLHLTGYDLSLEECKRFRQWQSKTPGHPEYGHTPGVELTTGPLGQGFATGVGMAIAERHLAAKFNRGEFNIIDHFTYGIVSDGDLMEGVASEAASLAGHLKLGKLIYLYDDNQISIEGSTEIAFREDVQQRFLSYGWQVQKIADGNDLVAIQKAIDVAKNAAKIDQRPSLIMVRTQIGFGSPKQGSASAHGEPLGKEAMGPTRAHFGWSATPFDLSAAGKASLAAVKERGQNYQKAWQSQWQIYQKAHSELAEQLQAQMQPTLPPDLSASLSTVLTPFAAQNAKGPVTMATRVAGGMVLNQLAKKLPHLLGGSADLAPSTKTLIDGEADFQAATPQGRNLRFGVREHAMAACANGMALHGGVIPYVATFFVFADYMRPAIRLAALMQQKVIYVFTHDSIGLGEDGPTHQPVEQLASLRAMPHLTVLRPADANETSEAWRLALTLKGPVALVLTRQNLPVLEVSRYPVQAGVKQGAYILADSSETPILIFLATGSEVHLALAAQAQLATQGVPTRVVSMPSWELFAQQPHSYQHQVLPPSISARLSIEAGVSFGWSRWLGEHGHAIALDHFGASAPYEVLMKEFGFHVDHLVQQAFRLLRKA